MAMSCDPCDCPEQHYRDKQTWRKAVITLLCRMISLITTLASNIAALVEAGGQGNGNPVPLFAWSANEQVWPFELDSAGRILYAKEINMGALVNAGNATAAHGIANFDTDKLFSLVGMSSYVGGATQGEPIPSGGGYYLYCNTTNVVVNCSGDRTSFNGKVRIIYAK